MTAVRILKWTMRNGQWVEVPVVLTRTPAGWVEVIPPDCPETDKLVAQAGY